MSQTKEIDESDWDLIDEDEKLKTQLIYNFKEYDYLFILRKYSAHLKFGLEDLETVRETIHQGKGGDHDSLLRLYTKVEYHYVSMFSLGLSLEEHLYKGLKDFLDEVAHKTFHQTVLDPWKKSEKVRLFKEIRNRIQHGKFFEGDFHYFFDLQAQEGDEKVSWSFEPDDNFWTGIYGKIDSLTKSYFDLEVKEHKYKLHFVVTEYQKSLSSLTDNIAAKYDTLFPDVSGRRREMEARLQEVKSKLEARGIQASL